MPTIDMDGIRLLGRELSNWGRWGDDDQRGTLNFITPERVREAAATFRRGVSRSLGELFDFETFAEDCAEDGVYECQFFASPLNIPGGVGSPLNPIAVK